MTSVSSVAQDDLPDQRELDDVHADLRVDHGAQRIEDGELGRACPRGRRPARRGRSTVTERSVMFWSAMVCDALLRFAEILPPGSGMDDRPMARPRRRDRGVHCKSCRSRIWSDIVCPWCYIGKRRFETALAAFPRRDEVSAPVPPRSFELAARPRCGATTRRWTSDRLSAKYGVGASLDQAAAMNDRVTAVAAGDGLDDHLESRAAGQTPLTGPS